MLESLTSEQKKKLFLYGGAGLVVLIVAIVLLLTLTGGGGDYQRHYERAETHFLHKEYEKTLDELDKALDIRQTEEAYLLKADVYYAQGDADEAVQVLYLGYARVGGERIAAMLENVKSQGGTLPSPVPDGDSVELGGESVRLNASSLVLSAKGLTDADLAPLAQLTELESLSLSNNAISDLSPLRGLTKLTSLWLSENRIGDLRPLQSLSALKTLYLDGNPISDLTPLYGLTQLRTLSMKSINVSKADREALRKALPNCRVFFDGDDPDDEPETLTLGDQTFLTDVTELDLSGQELTDISALAKCTKLSRLDLSGNKITDISALAQLRELEWLSLRGNQVSDLMPLMSLTKLSYLDAGENALTDLTGLHYLNSLEELALDGDSPRSFEALSVLANLKRLDLDGTGLKDEDLDRLAELTGLKELSIKDNPDLTPHPVIELKEKLSGCAISHDALRWSVKLGGRTFYSDAVVLEAAGLGATSLEGLEHFTELVLLDLDDNGVSDLSPLYGLTKLRTVFLRGNAALTAEQLDALREKLPNCLIVSNLDPEPEPSESPGSTETPAPTVPPASASDLDAVAIARGVVAALDAEDAGSLYAVLWDDSLSRSEGIRLGFVTELEQLTLRLVEDRIVTDDPTAAVEALSLLKASGADAVILAMPEGRAQALTDAASALNYTPVFIQVW